MRWFLLGALVFGAGVFVGRRFTVIEEIVLEFDDQVDVQVTVDAIAERMLDRMRQGRMV